MFTDKKIFILGMARSGFEAANLLAHYNNRILVTDIKDQAVESITTLKELGVDFVVTSKPDLLLDETYDYVIKNPGIRGDHDCVLKARKLGIPVINEVEMAYHFLPKNLHIIGVTGSNGKTTTVSILNEFLLMSNLPVHLGGNIGYPLSSLVNKVKEGDILLLEISDHQLHDMYDFKTDISVLTNLTETHLDFNGTYTNYKNIKKRIFNNHTKEDIAILNFDNADVLEVTKDILAKKIYFSSKSKADIYIKDGAIFYKDTEVIELDEIRVVGIHNYENIMCAIAVAKIFSVTNEVIKKVLADFNGVEHRIEYVKKVNDRVFYNDSKATNNKSTEIALSSFKKPVILILGGLDRGQSFFELAEYMDYVKTVIALGEVKDKIKEFCDKIKKDCVVVSNLTEATKAAYNISDAGDVILLSPACASWDMYDSFEQRGDEFKKVVNELI